MCDLAGPNEALILGSPKCSQVPQASMSVPKFLEHRHVVGPPGRTLQEECIPKCEGSAQNPQNVLLSMHSPIHKPHVPQALSWLWKLYGRVRDPPLE